MHCESGWILHTWATRRPASIGIQVIMCATQGHYLDSRCIIYGENADRLQVSGEKSSGSRSKVDQYTAKSKMDLAHGWYPCRTSLENRYEINLRTL
jgi:hypothetical protein